VSADEAAAWQAAAAVVQALAAIAALAITMGLAVVAKRTLDATSTAARAAEQQASASALQVAEAEAGRRDAEYERLLAAVPILSARRILPGTQDVSPHPATIAHRRYVGVELVNVSDSTALAIRTGIVGLAPDRRPLTGARTFEGAQVPMLGPGETHTVWIEPSGSYRPDDGRIGWDWMRLRITWSGVLGARCSADLDFAPNDAPDRGAGEPGYGERFVFGSLTAEVDGSGRFPPVVADPETSQG
jgi:hypothetical protein